MPIHTKPLSAGLILTPVIVVLALGAWTIGNGISFGASNGEMAGKFDDAQVLSGEAVCGNGLQESGEQCDPGPDGSSTCRSDCTVVRCGDGIADVDAGEQCDSGSFNGAPDNACSLTCEFRYCGDGFLGGAEQCDDKNQVNGDGCDNACRVENGFACTAFPTSPSVCTAQHAAPGSAPAADTSSSAPVSAPDDIKPFYNRFSSSAAAVTPGAYTGVPATIAAYAPVLSDMRQTEPSFDASLMRVAMSILQGRRLSSADEERVPVLSAVLDTVIRAHNEQDPYFLAMTALVTPLTEDMITAQGLHPAQLSAGLSAAARELATVPLTDVSLQSLAARIVSDTRSPVFAQEQPAAASIGKSAERNDVAGLQAIVTLATTLGARATPPSQVQSTLTAIADTATQTLAADTSVLYPGVSSADLTSALEQVRTAAASADISPAGIQSILTAAERLAQIMRAGGVDITRAPVEPSTKRFMALAASTDGHSEAVDPQKMIDERAKAATSHEADVLRSGTPAEKMQALTAWADSRTPSILRLIGRLPEPDQSAARAQWESMKSKLKALSADAAHPDAPPIRAAIEEMGAYTIRLETQVQKHFSAFDRFVDFFQRNVFHIAA